MSFNVVEVTSEEEFLETARVLYESFHNPFNPFYELFNGIEGTVEEQIQAKAKRHASTWRDSSTKHWLKIVEEKDTGSDVVAAASWEMRREAPDMDEPEPVARWHPEGSLLCEFATKWFRELEEVRKPFLKKPHLEVDQIVTLPAYRRRGLSAMLMDWGLSQADDLGLDVFVDSVPVATSFYEAMGFELVKVLDVNMTVPGASLEWKRLAAVDHHMNFMMRPSK